MSTSHERPKTRFDVDLEFELNLPSEEAGSTEAAAGKITAAGSDIVVDCTNLDVLLGARLGDINALRGIAQLLADRGVTLELRGPDGMVARLGDVQTSLAQRVLTRSKNIELGSVSNLVSMLAQRSKNLDRVTAKELLPPSTLFPLVPTVARNVRRRVTTTHYTYGSGRPRLIFGVNAERFRGKPPRIFELTEEVTTIGSAPDVDVHVEGASAYHAEIRHTREDEYVLYSFGKVRTGIDASKSTSGLTGGGVILRTGSRVQIGEWRMAFYREEYADHGRPYGGRSGGEFAHQKSQAPRVVKNDGPSAVTS